jgi:hypothetical protein
MYKKGNENCIQKYGTVGGAPGKYMRLYKKDVNGGRLPYPYCYAPNGQFINPSFYDLLWNEILEVNNPH